MLCIFGFMYVCMFVLLHIDLFSFSWLQVCLNKFSAAPVPQVKLILSVQECRTTARKKLKKNWVQISE